MGNALINPRAPVTFGYASWSIWPSPWLPAFFHFGIGLPSRDAVLAFRDRLVADGVPVAEEWDEPDYVSVKCLDPDGYVVEVAWEPDE